MGEIQKEARASKRSEKRLMVAPSNLNEDLENIFSAENMYAFPTFLPSRHLEPSLKVFNSRKGGADELNRLLARSHSQAGQV